MAPPRKRRKYGNVYSHFEARENARVHAGDIYANEFYQSSPAAPDKATAILDSVKSPYDNYNSRFKEVQEAAPGTFTWIVSPTSCIRDWIVSSPRKDLLWVLGKAGSGKSTLMKFMVNNVDIYGPLQSSAGDKKVLVLQHFFWYDGIYEQMSFSGFMRNLLHQLCQADSSLIEASFKPRWDKTRLHWAKHWNETELWESLVRSLQSADFEVCVFIDALDECQPASRHHFVRDKLRELSKIANVRICVSARSPEGLSFASVVDDMHVQLEDQTNPDVRCFAATRLANTQLTSSEIGQLVSFIAKNADGVFLWANLVVETLCERAGVDPDFDRLRICLWEFPSNLEAYYKKRVYDRIHSTWQKGMETAQFLNLALALHSNKRAFPRDLDWRIFWAASRWTRTTAWDHALSQLCEVYTATELQFHRNRLQTLINAATGGLLSVQKRETYRGSIFVVDFAHQTVVDFLKTPTMKGLLQNVTPCNFEDIGSIPAVILAICKMGRSELDVERDSCYDSHQILWFGFRSMVQAPNEFEAQLEQVALYFHEQFCRHSTGVHFLPGMPQSIQEPEGAPALQRELDSTELELDRSVIGTVKALLFCSHYEYASRVFAHWPHILYQEDNASRAFDLTIRHKDTADIQFLQLLFDKGASVQHVEKCWKHFVVEWAREREQHSDGEKMWKVAKLLIEHGAPIDCNIELTYETEDNRMVLVPTDVATAVTACVPEEFEDELEEVLTIALDKQRHKSRKRLWYSSEIMLESIELSFSLWREPSRHWEEE